MNSPSSKTSIPPMLLLTLAAVGVVYYFVDPSDTGHILLPQCPLRLLTGLACPLCGLQRSLHAMLHGHFIEAFSYNYFLVLVIPLTIVILVAEYNDIKALESIRQLVNNRKAQIAALIIFIGWGVVRNILSI